MFSYSLQIMVNAIGSEAKQSIKIIMSKRSKLKPNSGYNIKIIDTCLLKNALRIFLIETQTVCGSVLPTTKKKNS